jgi:NAD(P)-dependent dehydrogenase (short-subunit alcohol dehydrogenase family)
MKIYLTGKAASITGAAGSLGKAYALAPEVRGAAIVVNDLGSDTYGSGGASAFAKPEAYRQGRPADGLRFSRR